MNNAPQYFQVVIVKGNFSQEMGSIFLNAGFNCVLAVQDVRSEPKAQKFIAEFCRSLLNGENVGQAFKKAEILTEDDSIEMQCCCAHKHKETCEWMKKLNYSNSFEMHEEHVLKPCPKLKGLHSIDCPLAMTFNDKYCSTRKPTDKEQEDYFWRICCCSEENDHAKLKYALMSNDGGVLEQVLFDHKKTTIELRCPLPVQLKPPYVERITIGRRLEIKNLIQFSIVNRCVNLTGPTGIGKTMLVKRAAEYSYYRRIFKDGVIYLDFLGHTDIIFLYRFISNALSLPSYNHLTELCNALSDLDILMVLDNIDPLLKQDKQEFIDIYNNLICHTTIPKFIIVSQGNLNLGDSKEFKLGQLSEDQAGKFLEHLVEKKKIEERRRRISWELSGKPSDIIEMSLRMNLGKDSRQTDSSLEELLKNIGRAVLNSESLLRILSYLPSGAYKFNLRIICGELGLNFEKIFGDLTKNPNSSKLYQVHSNLEFIWLKSNVLSHLEERIQHKIDFVIVILSHLGKFARCILKELMSTKYNIGAENKSSLLFVNAGLDRLMWASPFTDISLIEKEIYDPIGMFKLIQPSLWHYISVPIIQKVLRVESTLTNDGAKALGEIVNCTASIFIILGNYKEALKIIERGKSCFKEFNLCSYLHMIALTEASIYALNNDFRKTREILKDTIKYYKSINSNGGLAEALLLKGLTVGEEKSYKYLKTSHDLFNSCNESQICLRLQLPMSQFGYNFNERRLFINS